MLPPKLPPDFISDIHNYKQGNSKSLGHTRITSSFQIQPFLEPVNHVTYYLIAYTHLAAKAFQ